MSFRCSQVLCKVDDLKGAVRDFGELGFTVEMSSAPGTSSAMIWFAEGPFIELFMPPKIPRAAKWLIKKKLGSRVTDRLDRWSAAGEGWRDLALVTDELSLRDAISASRVNFDGPLKNKGVSAAGMALTWEMAAPAAELPFVVSAFDPDPRPENVSHRNGASAIVQVNYGHPAELSEDFAALVGAEDADGDPVLHLHVGAPFGVVSVSVAGLDAELDAARLHGAVLVSR